MMSATTALEWRRLCTTVERSGPRARGVGATVCRSVLEKITMLMREWAFWLVAGGETDCVHRVVCMRCKMDRREWIRRE